MKWFTILSEELQIDMTTQSDGYVCTDVRLPDGVKLAPVLMEIVNACMSVTQKNCGHLDKLINELEIVTQGREYV